MSELVTYLNDAVLLAPSMLLALPVTWTAVNDSSFDLTLSDAWPPGHRAGLCRRTRRTRRIQHR